MAWYRQYGLSVDFSPAHREEMWSRLLCKLLMYLWKIKNWLPLCRVNIFMMMAGTEWVVRGIGFTAISHYIPNILSIMMCCILLWFYMLLKYFVISCNRHSICEAAKHYFVFFPIPKSLQMNITLKCFFSAGDLAVLPFGCCIPTKRASIATILWLSAEDPIGLLMYKWLKQ